MQYINRKSDREIVLIFRTLEVNICCHAKCLILQECTDMFCLYNAVC